MLYTKQFFKYSLFARKPLTHGTPFVSGEFVGFLEYLANDHKGRIPSAWSQSDGEVERLCITIIKAVRIP